MANKNLHLILVILSFVSWTLTGTSQKFHNYTIEDGLPSSECYDVVQDSTGYIWVATDRGIARFDNYEWKVFDESNGLQQNSVFRLFPYKDTIWFSTYNSYVQYIAGDSVYTPSFTPEVKKLVESSGRGRISRIAVNDSGIVVFCFGGNSRFYFINHENQILEKNVEGANIIIQNGNRPAWGVHAFLNQSEIQSRIKISIQFNPSSRIELSMSHKDFMHGDLAGTNFYSISDSIFLFAQHSFLYLYKGQQMSDSLELHSKILDNSLHQVDKNLFVIGLNNSKPFVFKLKDNKITPTFYEFQHKNITAGLLDKEGGHWMTTLTNGILYQPEFGSRSSSQFKNRKIRSLYLQDQSLYLESDDSVFHLSYPSLGILHKVSKSEIYEKNRQNNTPLHILVDSLPIDWHSYFYSINDTLVSLQFYGFTFFKNGKILVSSAYSGIKNKINSVVLYKDKLFALGTDGLFKIQYPSLKPLPFQNRHNIFSKSGSRICALSKKMVVATLGNGMYVYNPKNDSLELIINQRNGLASNTIHDLYKDSDSTIWLGTSAGISRVTFSIDSILSIKSITNFNQSHGIQSKEIYLLTKVKNNLVYSGNYGIGITPIRPNNPSQNPKTLLLPNGKDKLQNNSSALFDLRSLTYKIPNKNRFRYVLVRNSTDTSIRELTENKLRFEQPAPGNYHLMVQGIDNHGYLSSKVATTNFAIPYPYYQTWWFYLLVFSSVSVVTLWIFQLRNRRIRKNLALQEELITQKQRAMTAQMNPHFIFNAMGSIQSLVLENKNDKAEQYLTKFANLTRKILDDSSKLLIPLNDELSRLQEYVDIENLRYNDSISFNVNIENDLMEENPFIPTMLLQTLIENAIIHGILPNKKQGSIELTIKKSKEELEISIQDDGVGLNSSLKSKSAYKGDKTSKGISLIKERLESLRILHHNEHFSISFKDRSEFSKYSGTQVKLKVPLLFSE